MGKSKDGGPAPADDSDDWYSEPQLEEMRRQAGILEWEEDLDGDFVAYTEWFEYHVAQWNWEGPKPVWEGFSDGQDVERFDTQAQAINYCQRLHHRRTLTRREASEPGE